MSGPCWPAVSSLAGQSCGRLWCPRAWPAPDWHLQLYRYPSYRHQHWKTTSSEHVIHEIIIYLKKNNRCHWKSFIFIWVDHRWRDKKRRFTHHKPHTTMIIKIEDTTSNKLLLSSCTFTCIADWIKKKYMVAITFLFLWVCQHNTCSKHSPYNNPAILNALIFCVLTNTQNSFFINWIDHWCHRVLGTRVVHITNRLSRHCW